MKKIFLILTVVTVFASASYSQRQYRGEKGVSSVGAIAGYAIDNRTFTVGIDYRYNILPRLRLAPSILHLVEQSRQNSWYVNADAHYLARISTETTIYPIAGLGLSFWRKNIDVPPTPLEAVRPDRTISNTRLGLNMGVGVERRITRDLILGAEFKYNLTNLDIYSSEYSNQAMLLGRIAYYF